MTDRTTGLLNREGMEQVLVKELERAARYRESLSLLFMDVDDFRRFNEVRGYMASDGALKALVTALKNLLRPTDFLGRWGGDEFVILTPQQESAACQLADIIREIAVYFLTEMKDFNRLVSSLEADPKTKCQFSICQKRAGAQNF